MSMGGGGGGGRGEGQKRRGELNRIPRRVLWQLEEHTYSQVRPHADDRTCEFRRNNSPVVSGRAARGVCRYFIALVSTVRPSCIGVNRPR